MVKQFVYAWDQNKDKLEEFIKTHKQEEYDSYEALVKLLFDVVINPVAAVIRYGTSSLLVIIRTNSLTNSR